MTAVASFVALSLIVLATLNFRCVWRSWRWKRATEKRSNSRLRRRRQRAKANQTAKQASFWQDVLFWQTLLSIHAIAARIRLGCAPGALRACVTSCQLVVPRRSCEPILPNRLLRRCGFTSSHLLRSDRPAIAKSKLAEGVSDCVASRPVFLVACCCLRVVSSCAFQTSGHCQAEKGAPETSSRKIFDAFAASRLGSQRSSATGLGVCAQTKPGRAALEGPCARSVRPLMVQRVPSTAYPSLREAVCRVSKDRTLLALPVDLPRPNNSLMVLGLW